MKKLITYFKAALAIEAALLLMAVSCPGPEAEPEEEPTPEAETKSAERDSFESSFTDGLYVKGNCIIACEDDSFQKAINSSRGIYRLQSDNQEQYVNVSFSDKLSLVTGDNLRCTIRYSTGKGETVLVLKLGVVKVSSERVWLWNEFQKTGVIMLLR